MNKLIKIVNKYLNTFCSAKVIRESYCYFLIYSFFPDIKFNIIETTPNPHYTIITS